MKRKYIDGTDLEWVDKYSSKYIHIEDLFSGYVSLVNFEKIKYKITVDYDTSDKCLFDDGYKCVVFLPDDEKWCVSTVFNTHDEIVEWYFDMTKENSIDHKGRPYFQDLYLDIAVSPELEISILDEDELKKAYDAKLITKSDFDTAYLTCNKIIDEIIPNKEFMTSFFHRYLIDLSKKIEI